MAESDDRNDGKAHASWREVTKWLLAGVMFLSGTLIQWHLSEFSGMRKDQIEDRKAIIEGQKALIQVVEQLKYLTANSADAQAWRLQIDRKIQEFIIEADVMRKRHKEQMPGFGR